VRIDLGAPRPDFVGSHELIPVILGATAFLDGLARCIDEPCRGEAPDPAVDGLLVDALLGLLSLRRTLLLWTDAAETENASSEVPSPSAPRSSEGSYLR
jgi:hypothetical protein